MTVTITKTKPVAATKGKVSTNVIVAAAHRYAEARVKLDERLAKLAALVEEVKLSEADLLSHADMLLKKDAGDEITAGPYVVKIGAKGKKAISFNKALIKEELGQAVFDQLAEFGIEDLKKYLTGHVMDEVVKYDYVNKRKVTVQKKPEA